MFDLFSFKNTCFGAKLTCTHTEKDLTDIPFPYLPSEEESEESSSGEVEIEQEVSSDPEDPRELHPGALLHRSSLLHNLPLMAEALAHGADVHAASEEEEGKTPLIQAVTGVRD